MDHEYTRLQNVTRSNIQNIVRNVTELHRNMEKIDTPLEKPNHKKDTKNLQKKTNTLVKNTSALIKDLKNCASPESRSEQKQRELQIEKITGSFNDAVKDFQKIQKKIVFQEEEEIRKSRLSSVSFNNVSFTNETDTDTSTAGGHQTQLQQSQIIMDSSNVDAVMIQERHAAIRQLEGDISDINTIMKDLGGMIEEQGEFIDAIEINTETTKENVQQSVKQLEKANEHKSSARRKKFIIAGIIAAVLLVIAIIIVIAVLTK